MKTANNNTEAMTTTTVSNHFEEAFILVAGHLAFDSGVCTFHDDQVVEAEIDKHLLEKGIIKIFSRFGDGREDDALPQGSKFVGSRKFMKSVRGVNITLSDPR